MWLDKRSLRYSSDCGSACGLQSVPYHVDEILPCSWWDISCSLYVIRKFSAYSGGKEEWFKRYNRIKKDGTLQEYLEEVKDVAPVKYTYDSYRRSDSV